MESPEIDERLDLIQYAAILINISDSKAERNKLADFIEALCRHRDQEVDAVTLSHLWATTAVNKSRDPST